MPEHDPSAAEQRTSRTDIYGIFASVFEYGLTPHVVGELGRIDEVSGLLPDSLDTDEAAADHYSLFGLNVLPFASSYLEPDGMLGGRTTDVAVHFGRAASVVVHQSKVPDHIGSELETLKHFGLMRAGGASVEDNERRFMDQHMLWWLPLFLPAVSRAAVQPYAVIADVLLDTVLRHRRELGEGEHVPGNVVPVVPPILEDLRTGLRDVGRFLATPAYTGMVLTRSDVEDLARRLELPRGFGDRHLMLSNLLETCVEYDRLSELLSAIINMVEEWKKRHDALALHESEIVRIIGREWARRAQGTIGVLRRIGESAPAG